MKIQTIIKTEAALAWLKLLFVAALLATAMHVIGSNHKCAKNPAVKKAMADSAALLKQLRNNYYKCNGQLSVIAADPVYQLYVDNADEYQTK